MSNSPWEGSATRYIRRTVYVAKCKCGEWSDTKEKFAPRERMCPSCEEWVPYVEQSVDAPDLNLHGYKVTVK